MDYEEPTIPTRVILETASPGGWEPHAAAIANLTRHEVWVQIEEELGELVYPERPVRLVLSSPQRGIRTAETSVLWHIDLNGKLVALMRPSLWDPPSRRAHSRAWLSIPASLHHEEGARPLSARTTNVGIGGFHCVSDGPIAVGHKLPVSLHLTPEESFHCVVEVVRVEDNPDDPTGRQAILGCRFLDLTREGQARLASALVALSEDVDEDHVPAAWRTVGVGAPSA